MTSMLDSCSASEPTSEENQSESAALCNGRKARFAEDILVVFQKFKFILESMRFIMKFCKNLLMV